ncbi:MAG: AAA family ATPase [Anaerolineales bacterium]|nr:AAA family ATPase [Anaerolineales bacterium]
MTNYAQAFTGISGGGKTLILHAVHFQETSKHPNLGLFHHLSALLDRHPEMAIEMVKELNLTTLRDFLKERLDSGETGPQLEVEELVHLARERARARGRGQAVERDIAAVILSTANYEITDFIPAWSDSDEQRKADHQQATTPSTSDKRSAFPILERFGVNLTQKAKEGKLPKIVSRDTELDLIIETLCRRTKRNPILIGHAGVGKTAIVEGLAQRVVDGKIPELLHGFQIWMLQPSSIVAGAHMVGELDKRMGALLEEVSQKGNLLFIDEVHTVIGAGGQPGMSDISSMLKPHLAKGDIACIAATTDSEYRRYFEKDKALERRFQPILVQELSKEDTLEVLQTLRDDFQNRNTVEIKHDVLPWLVEFAAERMRNRYFPDKAIDLLEQCAAYASAQGIPKLTKTDVESVALRMIGVPQDLNSQLDSLKQELLLTGLLDQESIQTLVSRLSVTMHSLDLRTERPNAVVLLVGQAAKNINILAETVAKAFLGSSDRQVLIELNTMIHAHDVSMLLGSPPGYVGYNDDLLLHKVKQIPWSVVRLERIDACHPTILEIIAQALEVGFFTDAQGRHIFLSDAIVLLTAELTGLERTQLGFSTDNQGEEIDLRDLVEAELGKRFVDQLDLILIGGEKAQESDPDWYCKALLEPLKARYAHQGLNLTWDHSIIEWLESQKNEMQTSRDWERLVETHLGVLLSMHISGAKDGGADEILLTLDRGSIVAKKSRKRKKE